ncbi:MAG: putative quinol monooxygenase [Pseudomonadota bacterium]
MLMVLGTAKLGEGALDKGREALATMIAASNAEKGCLHYSYAQDILDPSVMHITEKWVDEAALAFHFQTPHMAAFQAALRELDVSIIEVAKHQADDGAPLL